MTDLERKLALLKKLREREQAGEPTAEKQPKIPPVDRSQPIPLAYGQERIWLLDRLAPGKNAFNMPCSMRLIGDLDTDALLGAVRAVIAHHEAMRTTFAEVDGLPRQIIRDAEWIEVPVEDLRSLPEDERQRRAHDAWNDVTNAPFDLDGGPLYRARIVRVADDEHHLLQTIHHIVSDGWSLDVLLRDLGECLKATRSGETPRLEPLPIQYVDFVAWQKERLRGETLDAMIRYWREQLDGAPQSLALPTDRPRPAVSANLGVFLESRLPTTLIDRLEAIARSERTSLYMVLLAGFAILMSRLAGQDDVLIGSPNAGRDQIETERLIGFFLNTLVLRCQVDPTADFSTLLAQVRSTVLGANENQDIPFEKLLEELQPERNLSQNPFFQVLFNMVNLPDSEADLQDLTIEGLGVEGIDSKFDLTFYIQEAPTSRGGGHYVHLSYDAELFDRARMTELLSQYARLLEQVAVDPRRAIGAVSLVTESAREVLPDPTAPLDDAWRGTIAAAMAGHAAEHPDAPAVIDVTGKVSFAETTARSGRIARSLIDAGLERGDVVAIWAHRSAPVVDALVGVLRAGGAFTMLDPQYPVGRLLDYVELSAPRGSIVLDDAAAMPDEVAAALATRCVDTIGDRRVHLPSSGEEPLPDVETPTEVDLIEIGPDDLAYVAFTSGSTGKPKAILGRHHSLTHFLPWLADRFGFAADDRHGLLSALSHDPLHRDVFMPLAYGATIVVPDPERVGEPGYLAGWTASEGLTILNLVPAMLQLLVQTAPDGTALTSVRRVFTVGDVLTRQDVAALYAIAPNARCVNYYGSTETQRAVSYVEIPRPEDPEAQIGDDAERGTGGLGKAALPLGRGLDGGVQLILLDDQGQQVGIGEPGEIHVRSHLLSRGYADAETTAERFLPNPFTGGDPSSRDRLYKTGDLGRYLPNGDVEFLGRADSQVKIRGFRVELQEIEAALGALPEIADCVVLVRGEGDDRALAAYLVAATGAEIPPPKALRATLADRLPTYMVPTAWAVLDALPLTRTGKLDRRALPEPDRDIGRSGERTPPRNDTEQRLAEIWCRWLNVDSVGIEDDFFELGGHSLLATQVLAGVRETFGVDVPLRRVFETPTLEGMALAIAREQAEAVDVDELGALLDDVENLSDEDLERLLADDEEADT